MEKKNVFFRPLPESPKPPPWPQFGQLGPFFTDIKIQDLKVNLKQHKKQLKVPYIGIFEEIDSSGNSSMGRPPPPPYSGNGRKKTFFSIDIFP